MAMFRDPEGRSTSFYWPAKKTWITFDGGLHTTLDEEEIAFLRAHPRPVEFGTDEPEPDLPDPELESVEVPVPGNENIKETVLVPKRTAGRPKKGS